MGKIRSVKTGERIRRCWMLSLLLSVGSAVAAEPNSDYVAPRLAGTEQPDINGIWQALNSANYDLEAHTAKASLQVRDGPHGEIPSVQTLFLGAVAAVPPGLGVVVGGGIPYSPAARAVQRENRALWSERDPEVKCYLPGVPRATYLPLPFQILQSADGVMIAYEYAGAVREIYMQDPGEAPVDSWMGWSAGRWQGDSLIVDVTGQYADTWLDRAGNHHSDQLKVTERYTPLSPHHLQYEATLEDPQTYTRPWTIRMPLYRRIEPNAQILDFKCVEFVEELMFGKWRRKPLPRTLPVEESRIDDSQ